MCRSVRLSLTFCFLNILKSHCWNSVKLCKHIYIYKTNTLNKKKKALGVNFLRVMSLCSSKRLFYIGVFTIIVQTRADQLLPKILMEQFDTLPKQCRHIEHMHDECGLNFFDKMTAMRTIQCKRIEHIH